MVRGRRVAGGLAVAAAASDREAAGSGAGPAGTPRSPRFAGFGWWDGWRGEMAMLALVCGLVVAAFPAVIFDGRTFSSALRSAGVNGTNPPVPGLDHPPDQIRLDQGASAWQFEPWAEVTSRAWRAGDVPLWNSDQGMGAPHAANFQSAVFDPLLAAVNIHPTPSAWDASFLLAFLVGAAAMYLFLRQLDLGRAAAFVGTAPFALSGYFFLYSNNQFFRAYIYLPVVFLLVHRAVTRPGARGPVFLGAAIAGNLLVGMPEASVFVLGAAGLYALSLLALPTTPLARGRALLRLAAAGGLGLALSAPLLIPALEYLPLSSSSHESGSGVGLATDPARLLLTWLAPYVFGNPTANLQGTGWSGTRNWVGSASIVAALGALASPGALRRHSAYVFLGIVCLVTAKVYGLPQLEWVGRIPGVERVNFPVFALPVVAFCVAVLTAIGVQGLSVAAVGRRRFLLLAGALVAGFGALLRANRDALATAPAPHLLRHLGLVAACTALASAGFLLRGRGLGRLMVSVVVLAELLVLAPRGFQGPRVDPYTKPAWLQFVISQTRESKERVFGLDAKLFPDIAGVYGVQDIRSIDALYPDRYFQYVRQFIQPEVLTRFVGGAFGQHEEKAVAAISNNPMFNLTGTRFVITGGQDPGDAPLREFFLVTPSTSLVRPTAFDINGDRRPVLFVHSGSRARLAVPKGASQMSFAFALDPAVFESPEVDGVDALVVPVTGSVPLWSTTFVPGRDPVRPEWREVTIDLPRGASAVELVVNPRGNSNADWAGFAGLRFGGGVREPGRQFRRVASSDGADVYENLYRLPRALVIHDVLAVEGEAGALARFESLGERDAAGALILDRFDPARQAVVEDLPPAVASRVRGCDTRSEARLRSYRADRVVIEVKADCPGILVLTDTYYPGWAARVNGMPERIYPTDLAFRGVAVEAGTSTVELTYRPSSFRMGVSLAAGGAAAGTIALIAPRLRRRRAGWLVRR